MKGEAVAVRTFGGFRKRTQTLDEWVNGTRWLAVRWRDLWGVYGRRMDPAMREAILVAVADVNRCRWCSYAHQTWGLEVGLSAEDIARLTGASEAPADTRIAAASAYARTRAEGSFGPVPTTLRTALLTSFDAGSADDVELVARGMHQANMAGNALDALLARWRGQAPADSRLLDDLALGSFAFAIIVVGVPVLAILLRRSPRRVLRDLRGFVGTYDAAEGVGG